MSNLAGVARVGRVIKPVMVTGGILVLMLVVSVSSASAAFGIESFDGAVLDADGTVASQAGSHPYEAFTDIQFNRVAGTIGQIPDESLRSVHVELPPGLVGNLTAVPQCTQAEFSGEGGGIGPGERNGCPDSSQVGVAQVDIGGVFSKSGFFPVYDMVPAPGSVATFQFNVGGVFVLLDASVRTASDYGVNLDTRLVNQALPLLGTKVTLWGEPSDPRHNPQRGVCLTNGGVDTFGGPCGSDGFRVPFLTNPTACTPAGVGLETRLQTDSWAGSSDSVSFFSHQPPPDQAIQVGPTGCERLPFDPKLRSLVSSRAGDSPTGLTVKLSFPDQGLKNPSGLATAALRDAQITLPDGMTINPAAAAGLGACSDARLGLGTDSPVTCPAISKIGTAEATTAVLDESLAGGIYIRSQASGDPESGQMFRLALVLENKERGLLIKLPGQVRVNAADGRIVTEFANNPQLPVGEISVDLKAGPRAPLATPTSCGVKTTEARLTSWAGQEANLRDSFTIPCPSGMAFAPSLEAGTANPIAGGASPFLLRLRREDGMQELRTIDAQLPPGLLGKLAGIPYCSDATLAAASARSGKEEESSPSCSAASEVGAVNAGAGAGSPYYVTGHAYLAGPYNGAPISLAVITPALAGPFDLGTVVVRVALRVDPISAQVTAVSDPLPRIVKGVPLRLRAINFNLDKPEFTLNPTNCGPMAVESRISGFGGATATPSSRFQVAGCERLAFKPRLALRLSGAPTRRGGYPKLRAVLRMPKQGANIRRARVLLPKTEFLENAHIRTICTRVQYAAGKGGGEACPKASVYGYAKAWSPLLDKPLQGPVYLRSSNHKLPDLVASLDGQIHVDLVGRIDAVRARIRNTFETVPDAPVSRFVLTMQGGRKGLLVNNTQLCKAKPRASVRFVGQNGKAANSKPLVKVARCGKKRK